jgi:hypothetical protein
MAHEKVILAIFRSSAKQKSGGLAQHAVDTCDIVSRNLKLVKVFQDCRFIGFEEALNVTGTRAIETVIKAFVIVNSRKDFDRVKAIAAATSLRERSINIFMKKVVVSGGFG